MSDQEGFLERWSRRKREATDESGAQAPAPESTDAPAPAHAASPDRRDGNGTPAAQPPGAPPAFDLASLPSLDSITATTDVRAFLAPGVPGELTRAALRRAWSVDPAIRNFVGLQENDWDFANPVGVPGFGDLPANFDVKKMVAQILGEPGQRADLPAPDPTAPSPAAAIQADRPQPPADSPDLKQVADAGARQPDAEESLQIQPENVKAGTSDAQDEGIVHRNEDIAMQQERAEMTTAAANPRRHHGGALPE